MRAVIFQRLVVFCGFFSRLRLHVVDESDRLVDVIAELIDEIV